MFSLSISNFQLDLFRLRERDLLSRYASEISQYQAQGESIENAMLLVCFQRQFFFSPIFFFSLKNSHLSKGGLRIQDFGNNFQNTNQLCQLAPSCSYVSLFSNHTELFLNAPELSTCWRFGKGLCRTYYIANICG